MEAFMNVQRITCDGKDYISCPRMDAGCRMPHTGRWLTAFAVVNQQAGVNHDFSRVPVSIANFVMNHAGSHHDFKQLVHSPLPPSFATRIMGLLKSMLNSNRASASYAHVPQVAEVSAQLKQGVCQHRMSLKSPPNSNRVSASWRSSALRTLRPAHPGEETKLTQASRRNESLSSQDSPT